MVFEAPEIEISSNTGNPSDIRNITGSIVLPTGASTFAEQQTQTTMLTSVDSKLNTLGQKTSVNSMPVVISSDQFKNSTPSLSDQGLLVRPIPYEPQSYSASASGFVTATTATDVFLISGSASKTIRISSVDVSATTTSGSPIKITINLIKRSTANSGGTSSVLTNVAHDSTNAASTAVARSYTANPTLGTAVGTIRSVTTSVQAAGLTDNDLSWDFVNDFGQPIILRGVAENLAVNFNSTTISGSVVSISVEWSEV